MTRPDMSLTYWRAAALPFAIVLLGVAPGAAPVAQPTGVPAGFTRIFDGRTTKGWHFSRTVHHGTTAIAEVDDRRSHAEAASVRAGRPVPHRSSRYKDFEFYVEAKPDPGYNSGIFLRSTEGGSAYQIELVRPGNTGALLGEQMQMSKPEYIGERVDINTVWKDGEWNSMRVRMTGEAPHITLWINGTKLWEAQLPQNDQLGRRLRRDDRPAAALERDLHGRGREATDPGCRGRCSTSATSAIKELR